MEVVKVDSVTSRPCRRSDGTARRAWRLSGYRGPNDARDIVFGVRVADSLHVRSTCWPPAQSVLSALRSRHRCWAYCSWVPPPGPCLLLQSSSSLRTDSILKLHPSSATSSCSSSSSSSSSVHHPKACASGREARPQTGASILQEFFRQSPHHRRQDPKEW